MTYNCNLELSNKHTENLACTLGRKFYGNLKMSTFGQGVANLRTHSAIEEYTFTKKVVGMYNLNGLATTVF